MADPLGGGWKRCSASTCQQCANGNLDFTNGCKVVFMWPSNFINLRINRTFPGTLYHIDDKIHFIFMVDLADLAETKSLVVSRVVLVMVKSPSVSFESTKSLGIEIMVVETHLQLLVRTTAANRL